MKKLIMISALIVSACQAQNGLTPKVQPGAYMIVSGKNYDAKELGKYAAALPPIYEKYGGYYVAFSPNYSTLEGTPDAKAIIISAWPSVDAANNFWTSPEYTEAKKLREGIGEFDVVVLPAIE